MINLDLDMVFNALIMFGPAVLIFVVFFGFVYYRKKRLDAWLIEHERQMAIEREHFREMLIRDHGFPRSLSSYHVTEEDLPTDV